MSYFSVERLTALSSIGAAGRVHVIGVCGVAMAQLAIMLCRKGYRVSGSDKDYYEPMRSRLKQHPIDLKQGFDANHISNQIDLVLIGNVAGASNPEVQAIEFCNRAYTIFPKLLYELAIEGKHSIVVSGTHGKSTTSALLALALSELKAEPSYFFGAASDQLPSGLELGRGAFSVVEGDEYDSAFFAKMPKFSFYKPHSLIVTSVEFDHADIYPSLHEINAEFDKLVQAMPGGSRVIACIDQANLRSLAQTWRSKAGAEIVTYGTSADAQYRLLETTPAGLTQRATVRIPDGTSIVMQVALPGAHNMLNAVAALAVLTGAGFGVEQALAAISKFKGVKRRQEVRFNRAGVILIEDFAHHPTAVLETLKSIRAAFPRERIWAVFEPRSNTSRRKVFQKDYIAAFAPADQVVLCQVQSREIDQGMELLDVAELSQEIGHAGNPSRLLPDASAIAQLLESEVRQADVVLLMSNGSFGGLAELLVQAFERKFKS